MEIRPDYRRLLKTLNHEEPDRVPLAELSMDTPIKDKLLGRPARTVEDEVAFVTAARQDYVYLRAEYDYVGTSPVVSTGTPRAWAWSAKPETESHSTAGPGPIQTLADIDSYPWPDPETVSIENLDRAARVLPPGLGIVQSRHNRSGLHRVPLTVRQ